MTEIYLHIVARMADYNIMDTHPYITRDARVAIARWYDPGYLDRG